MSSASIFKNALVLTGPTGSGKSQAALSLVAALDAEIVSMDSMALFRGMDIGTAKATVEERRCTPHHLIDVLDPWESSSVAWWLEQAVVMTKEIELREKRAFFVGGTPLYLKAMLHGLFDGPPADARLREELMSIADDKGHEHLHQLLAEVDGPTAARLHPNDIRRVVRALEVWQLTNKPISYWQRQWTQHDGSNQPQCVWVDLPRDVLYERINGRVDSMFAAGLIDEVETLLQLPKPLSREAQQALGYKEVIGYLQGNATLADTIAEIQTRSRNFAKRQITWFRHLPNCRPVSEELTIDAWDSRMI